MPVRIMAIPFDEYNASFNDEDLSNFLINKKIFSLKPEFFQQNGKAYWTLFIEYETVTDAEVSQDERASLNDPQKLLFKRLQEWRKATAEKEGVPVFIVATNKQLIEVIKKSPLTRAALKEIQGFGTKKVERYGVAITEIVKAFHQRKPLYPKDKHKPSVQLMFAESAPKPPDDSLQQSQSAIENFLHEQLLLSLKPKETLLQRSAHGLSFLGMRIFPNMIRVKPENRKRSLKRLNNTFSSYLRGNIHEDRLIQSATSIVGHLKHFCPTAKIFLEIGTL